MLSKRVYIEALTSFVSFFFLFMLIIPGLSIAWASNIVFNDTFTSSDGVLLETYNSLWHRYSASTSQVHIFNNLATSDEGANSLYMIPSVQAQNLCAQAEYTVTPNKEEFLDLSTRYRGVDGQPLVQFMFYGNGLGFTHAYGTRIDFAGTFPTGISNEKHVLTFCEISNNLTWYIDGTSHGNFTDPNPVAVGVPDFSASHGSKFDNFKVFDGVPTYEQMQPETSTPPVATTFPYYLQTDSQWKNDVYDKANIWAPNNPSFGRWGCAVTDASMLMNYYGITKLPNGSASNPGALNTWLTGEPDGYVRNGMLNWHAISRATKWAHTQDPSVPTLEYKYGGSSLTDLRTELTAGRPVIVEVPGHFIAAYAYEAPATYSIRDPYYENKTRLSDYGNTLTSLRKFFPTSSDLSYLSVYGDSDISTTLLLRQAGAFLPVSTDTGVQDPIIDPVSGQSQGDPYSFLEYAKPEDGTYKLMLSKENQGLGSFQILAYDEFGNPTEFSQTAYFGASPLVFLISFSKDGVQSIQKQLSFDYLQNSLLSSYSPSNSLISLLTNSERQYDSNLQLSKISFESYLHNLDVHEKQINPLTLGAIKDDSQSLYNQLY